MAAGPASDELAALGARLAACEARVGAPAAGSAQAPAGGLAAAVAELTRQVDAVFKQDQRLADFEQNIATLDQISGADRGAGPRALLHGGVKQSYVAQHAGQLREFARCLKEVESLERYIAPPPSLELPRHEQELRRIEAGRRGARRPWGWHEVGGAPA
ncbi:unnamed protein product, partial [Prorocentrum cordatum]